MGLISFIKNAGEKIFKSEERREQEKAALILDHIKKFGFDTSGIQVTVDDDKVTLTGKVDTQENKKKNKGEFENGHNRKGPAEQGKDGSSR